jgi:hypothetical protein
MLDMKLESNDLLKSILMLLASCLALVSTMAMAQQDYEYTKHSYSSGQHTEVAYEGWQENDGGTVTLTFG